MPAKKPVAERNDCGLQIRVTRGTYKKLNRLSHFYQKTMSAYIRELIKRDIENKEREFARHS